MLFVISVPENEKQILGGRKIWTAQNRVRTFNFRGRDEELILDVNKSFTQLDSFDIRILNRMLDVIDQTHRPIPTRPQSLHFARSTTSAISAESGKK